MDRIFLYDTTLRDGTQAEDISFQVEDKVRIAKRLDDLGIDYIEGGWPGSNPKDITFFQAIQHETLTHSKIAAFGSTRRARVTPAEDNNIQMLIQAKPDTITIFRSAIVSVSKNKVDLIENVRSTAIWVVPR